MCLFGAPVRSDKLGFSAGFDADWGMVARLNRCSDFSSLNFVAFYHICTAVAAAATQSFPPGLTPAYLLLHICLHSCCMLNFWLSFSHRFVSYTPAIYEHLSLCDGVGAKNDDFSHFPHWENTCWALSNPPTNPSMSHFWTHERFALWSPHLAAERGTACNCSTL